MPQSILILNAGSSTLKCALFQSEQKGKIPFEPIWEGFLDFHKSKTTFSAEAVQELLKPALSSVDETTLIGHRVVHGGEEFINPTLITPKVKEAIRNLSTLAPLHNPANLQGIEIMEKISPTCRQIAVFDTAFHHTMPEAFHTYAVPLEWKKRGFRRYGFHGISHAYCTKRTRELLGKEPGHLITCHLGNGSSLTAVRNGKSVATTMGFTPMEGLIMGTRSGSIDPGLLLHQLKNLKAEELDQILNYASGLFGICGTKDMRDVLSRKNAGDASAQLAYDMFINSLCWHIGALMGCLGKLDALVFAGGIGENSPEIREAACDRFRTWGIELDKELNRTAGLDHTISKPGSSVPILVIKTREDLEIAKACLEFG